MNFGVRAMLYGLFLAPLGACQVEIDTSLTGSDGGEAQARMSIARHLEALPNFASPSAGSTAAQPIAVVKSSFEDATISGPNMSLALSGRFFFCIEATFAGPGNSKVTRYAKAEVPISPTSGRMSATPSSVTEERCVGSEAPRRFDELLALRQAALRR